MLEGFKFMLKKDYVYKTAHKYAIECKHIQVIALLERYKATLKKGKADSLLRFYMSDMMGARELSELLGDISVSSFKPNSYLGYSSIQKAFPSGISVFKGVIYLKKNIRAYEDYSLRGTLHAIVINNLDILSKTVDIKTSSGFQLSIGKKETKADMFIGEKTIKALPYDMKKWNSSEISLFVAGIPTPSSLRQEVKIRGGGRKKTPMELFMDRRIMNLSPSKSQRAKMKRQKEKVIGCETQEEGSIEYNSRIVDGLRRNVIY